jgi:hypothetical protein
MIFLKIIVPILCISFFLGLVSLIVDIDYHGTFSCVIICMCLLELMPINQEICMYIILFQWLYAKEL